MSKKMSTYIPIHKIHYPYYKDKYYIKVLTKLVKIQEVLSFIADIPMEPAHAREIKKDEKIKAIRGTTGIEGNIIEEEEIRTLLDDTDGNTIGELEVINSGKVHNFIIEWSLRNPDTPIPGVLIKQVHKYTTENIPYPGNQPGKYRNFEVTYGYPAKKSPLKTELDVQREMTGLIEWINNDKDLDTYPILPWLIKGIMTHYALSRIHPFSDGNGRTARAIEALIFYHKAKINDYCFYGVSNYCYRNRDAYIAELAKVDSTGDATSFLLFCLNGFHESIIDVKNKVNTILSGLLFMDYVHNLRRRRLLKKREVEVIDLIVKLKELSYNDYMKIYFNDRSEKTKTRYLKKLSTLGLIKVDKKDKRTSLISPNLDILNSLRRNI